ncbi:ABC transporter permease [Candidatus Thorarchaeota archaeon]|nr:MAG: ABC transporter permease [Candidatus Thorarchaeota archaeon]
MLKYALKRVARSYKLFLALTIGVLVATTFFASTNVAADILARDALDTTLEGVIYDFTANSVQSNWTADDFASVENELQQISEVIAYSRTTAFRYDHDNTDTEFDIFGLEWGSDMTSGIQIVSGNETLGHNETYVVAGSTNESSFLLGQEVSVPIRVLIEDQPVPLTLYWNLTVAGIVDLPESRRYAMQQNQFAGILLGPFGVSFDQPYNMMLVDWALTISPLLDAAKEFENRAGLSVLNSIHMKVDRAALIDPYDIPTSTDRVSQINQRLSQRLDRFDVTVRSNLQTPLLAYTIIAALMNVVFISLSLPIFFMAYFTGTMTSEVSYNLRRREIGLLLTKGYKRGTIRNMFLFEGILVGALAGAASIFLGTAVAWYVLGIEGLGFLTVVGNNVTSIIISIITGMVLALIAVWRPANRASKLEIVDALKQYVYIEETSEYKKLLPTISLVLGGYKLIVWILGINIAPLLTSLNPGNILLSILIVAWVGIDSVLNFLGPLMFLFGATKVFMRGSQRFQEVVVEAGKRFFGAFGKLATRNVKRNPARNAAMVFLLSLIVSYGIFTVGSLYSEYDRVERDAYYDVGADVRLQLEDSNDIEAIMAGLSNYSGINAVTAEYRMTLNAGTTSVETRGITPDEWLNVAFWEPSWFIGDFDEMFESLDDDGIILSVTIAEDLALDIGDGIFVRGSSGGDPHLLTIVGLIGFQSILEDLVEQAGFTAEGNYPSFISTDFLNDSAILPDATGNILIDAVDGANGTAIQEELIHDFPGAFSSYSYTSQVADYYERPIESGITQIRWVAVTFAVILALVGTALVILLTLKEKEVEIALISVRGFSRWQLFKTLLAEMLVMVVFSLLLGLFVGFVQIFGNISLLNQNATDLILSRFVLGGISGITMLTIVGVVLIAASIPVWWASRKPENNVDVLRK